jgi:hypothetical protein
MIAHQPVEGILDDIRGSGVREEGAEPEVNGKIAPATEFPPEYEMLRREILQNHVMALQIIAGTVTLTALALGFAFGEHVDQLAQFIFAAAAGWIVFIGTTVAIEKENASLTIAAYMRQFIERYHPNSVLWETRLAEFRKVQAHKAHSGWMQKYHNFFVDLCELGYTRLQSLLNYLLLALLSFLAAVYKLFQFWSPASPPEIFDWTVHGLVVLLILLPLVLTVYLVLSRENWHEEQEHVDKLWKDAEKARKHAVNAN